MFLLSLLFSAQDASPANRARIFPLEWVDASKFADMAPCSLRPVDLDFAKVRTSLDKGYIRGDMDLRYAYLVSAQIYSDAAISGEVHAGLSAYANFGAFFSKGAHVVRLATDVLGLAREKRSIIVLMVSEKPVESIECEAFTTQ